MKGLPGTTKINFLFLSGMFTKLLPPFFFVEWLLRLCEREDDQINLPIGSYPFPHGNVINIIELQKGSDWILRCQKNSGSTVYICVCLCYM